MSTGQQYRSTTGHSNPADRRKRGTFRLASGGDGAVVVGD